MNRSARKEKPARRMCLKLVVFVLLFTLLLPGLSRAGEFGVPSNMAGIWKINLEPGIHLISFPLLPEVASVTGVLGDYFPDGATYAEATRLVTLEDGEYKAAWYNSAGPLWSGTLLFVDPHKAYWLIIPGDSGLISLPLVGKSQLADSSDMGMIEPGMSLVAAPMPYQVAFAGSGLVSSGFHAGENMVAADRVYSWNGDEFLTAWPHSSQGWIGQFYQLEPEKGYIFWRGITRPSFHWLVPKPAGMAELDGAEEVFPAPMVLPGSTFLRLPDFSTAPWEEEKADVKVKSSSRRGER